MAAVSVIKVDTCAEKDSYVEDDTTRCSFTLALASSKLDSTQKTSKSDEKNLGAYEKWLLDKEKARRAKLLSKSVLDKELENTQLQLKAEKEEKVQVSMIKYKMRLEKKDRVTLEEHAKRKEELIKKERDFRVKKCEMDKKSFENFQAWIGKKNGEKRELLQRLKDLTIAQGHDTLAKRRENKDAFEKWCREAASRPNLSRRSYGYSNGLLIGYYDSSMSAHPAYVNPRPWKYP